MSVVNNYNEVSPLIVKDPRAARSYLFSDGQIDIESSSISVYSERIHTG